MECKSLQSVTDFFRLFELIDTLWNVNPGGEPGKMTKKGINRYIMECKYEIIASFTGSETGINRYIMECKYNEFRIKMPNGYMN